MDPLVKPNKRWIIRATKKKPAKKLDHIPSDLPYFLTRKTLQHECNVVTTDSHRHTQTAMRCRRKQAWQLKITGTEHTQLRDHTSTHTHTRAHSTYLSYTHFLKAAAAQSAALTLKYTSFQFISPVSAFAQTQNPARVSKQSRRGRDRKKKEAQKGVSAQSWKLTSRHRQFHRNLEKQRKFWSTGRKHPCLSLWCFTCRMSSAVQTDATSSYILRLQRSWEIHLHSSHT